MTSLSPLEEVLFQAWARAHGIQDQDDPNNQFDYRGLYKETNGTITAPHTIRNMAQQHNQFMSQSQDGGSMEFPDPYMAQAEMQGNMLKYQGDMRKEQMKAQMEDKKMQHKLLIEQMKMQHQSMEKEKDRQMKAQQAQAQAQQRAEQAQMQMQQRQEMGQMQLQAHAQEQAADRAHSDNQMQAQQEFELSKPQPEPQPQGGAEQGGLEQLLMSRQMGGM